jgi:hypothetical protein
MRTSAARIALGVSIAAATLAASNAAHATTWVRWKNKSEPNNNVYFLGVPGGCIPTTRGCVYNSGTGMITWAYGQSDQDWQPTFPGTALKVINRHGSPVSGCCFELAIANDSFNNNVNVIISAPGAASNSWDIVEKPDANLPAPYPGCYVFKNRRSGKVMSIRGGVPGNGAQVMQYDLCKPGSPACGNPSNAWHPDQFWCPLLVDE